MNWLTYHRRESQKHKNDQILSLHKSLASVFYKKTYLGPSLWFKIFWELHKPTAWASSNTGSNTYIQNTKGFPPSVLWLMNYLQSKATIF